MALAGGAQALNQPQGALAKGMRADIVVLDPDHPALIGRSGDAALDSWIFSGGNACVKHVFVAGRQLVQDGRHIHEEQILKGFRVALARLQFGR
jgi:formimidoylglutamate deiminase